MCRISALSEFIETNLISFNSDICQIVIEGLVVIVCSLFYLVGLLYLLFVILMSVRLSKMRFYDKFMILLKVCVILGF